MELKSYLATWRARVNRYLEEYFERRGEHFEKLKAASTYSLHAGGKRIRPILAVAACEIFGKDGELTLPFGCAIEMIHTFSLIHDDLPSMDNDDLRRQKPTCHKVYGDAHAILAGDTLLSEAFRMMSDRSRWPDISTDTAMEVIFFVADSVGLCGMVGGQSLDLLSENVDVSPEILQRMHYCKTARFMSSALYTGARIGNAQPDDLENMVNYGEKIGLAFQISDDILNVTGDPEILGKKTGTDNALGKATWPKIFGVEASQKRAQELAEEAKAYLDGFDEKAESLRLIADFIVNRES